MNIDRKLIAAYASLVSITILGLLLVNVLNISYPLTILSKTASGELAVVGEGKVEVVPDTATVDVGISVTAAETVEAAQRTINTVNNTIIAAMKALGIDKEQIKTSNYSIYPNYTYQEGQNRTDGYNGNVSISIKVSDTQLVSRVIEEATKAGANQINGTNFTVESPEKYREEARNKAIANAKEQAQKLTQALGIRLGRVVNIVEYSPTFPPVYFTEAKQVGLGGAPPRPDIEPGSQTITSTVTLYFEKN